MSEILSSRHQLPYLAVAQAQKEITHNEAVLAMDALLHPVVEGEINTPPTITAGLQQGKCWLIGQSPTGIWQGKPGQIAYWTGSSWRYFPPVDGMRVRNNNLMVDQIWASGTWRTPATISNPTGGTVIDIEARAILASLLSLLRTMGMAGQ
jgi:hypothetical protein